MKALVTGGTGFIGGALARALLARGDSVRVLARDPHRAAALQTLGAEVVPGDVTDAAAVDAAMKGVDSLFHCAATVEVVKPDRDAMLAVNVGGTRTVLEAALRHGVQRVIHLSSIAAIGRHIGRVDETAWNTRQYTGPYEESKHRAEEVALEMGKKGLAIVHVLPSVVIGPGDEKSGSFFRRYLRRKIPALPSKEGALNFVHVTDLVDGILRAHDRGVPGERYIFSQATYRTSELFDELAALTGIPPPRRLPYGVVYAAAAMEEWRARLFRSVPRVSRDAVKLATRPTRFSSRKARERLGWAPIDFRLRLHETVLYWADQEGVRVAPRA